MVSLHPLQLPFSETLLLVLAPYAAVAVCQHRPSDVAAPPQGRRQVLGAQREARHGDGPQRQPQRAPVGGLQGALPCAPATIHFCPNPRPYSATMYITLSVTILLPVHL